MGWGGPRAKLLAVSRVALTGWHDSRGKSTSRKNYSLWGWQEATLMVGTSQWVHKGAVFRGIQPTTEVVIKSTWVRTHSQVWAG